MMVENVSKANIPVKLVNKSSAGAKISEPVGREIIVVSSFKHLDTSNFSHFKTY